MYITTEEDIMFEVIKETETIYNGNNWILALTLYEGASNQDDHVFLWENDSLDREYHPELGHNSKA